MCCRAIRARIEERFASVASTSHKAAEGLFLVDDVRNLGPHYDPTLVAWESNFQRAWPRFAEHSDELFRRRFYLLSLRRAFRARSLQVYSILFRNDDFAERLEAQPREASELIAAR